VGRSGLLCQYCPRSAAEVNTARFEVALELFAEPLFAGFGAAHRASAAVRGAENGFRGRCGANKQVRTGLHTSANDHWLANVPVARSDFLATWAKCARRAF